MMDTAIVNRLTAVGAAWSPNLSRAPLPKQPTEIQQPFTPASATATSGTAFNAIDGFNDRGDLSNYESLWTSTGALPQSVTLNLGHSYNNIDALFYLPRRDGNAAGIITSYQISLSPDGTTFSLLTSGTWAADATVKRVFFAKQTAQYVRLTATAVSSGTAAVICDVAVGDTTPPPSTAVKEPVIKRTFQSPGTSIRTAIGRFGFDPAFSGKAKSVAVYDLGGHLVGQKQVNKETIDLHEEFGAAHGVYIVRVKVDK
jgi:alpha-L-fucosidase